MSPSEAEQMSTKNGGGEAMGAIPYCDGGGVRRPVKTSWRRGPVPLLRKFRNLSV
jgi:hypothetical protein